MKMTPALLWIGGLAVFWASVYIAVGLPALTIDDHPSEVWRPLAADEQAGRDLFVRNGCSYCHSHYTRVIDRDVPLDRVSEAGDYYGARPPVLGTERTGPDLAEEGGQRSDDWQFAHFVNPRYTRPLSLMPSWEFLGERDIRMLTAYVQSLGLKNADPRVARQREWKPPAMAAYRGGPDRNIAWLHEHVPPPWRPMPNPYPATESALGRGHRTYQQYCINCHGPVGDGQTECAKYLDPPPLNFTTLNGRLWQNRYIGGIFYYQIMNGITGTAMPYFKDELQSQKIWEVSNYVAVKFVGYTDADIEPKGVDASFEPRWKNPYLNSPATQAATTQPTERQP